MMVKRKERTMRVKGEGEYGAGINGIKNASVITAGPLNKFHTDLAQAGLCVIRFVRTSHQLLILETLSNTLSYYSTISRAQYKMPTCPGCNIWFPIGGYSSHLKQTQNPACLAVRQTHEALGDFDDSDAEPSDLDNDNNAANPFEGDALGRYKELDVETDDPHNEGCEVDMENFDSEDEEDEWGLGPGDEEDAENGAQEDGWELPLPENAEGEMRDDEMNEDIGDGEDGEPEQFDQDIPLIGKGGQTIYCQLS